MLNFVQHDNDLNEQALKHPVVLNEVKHLAEMTMILVGKSSEIAVMLNEVKQLTELPCERHSCKRVLVVNDRTHAVGVRGRQAALEDLLFSPVRGDKVAPHGRKE